MIQFKRGTTNNWRSTDTNKKKPALFDGQPGYDRIKHKLKVGDGKTNWKELPYATGLFDYEILNSEKTAKERYKADDEDITVISYGREDPDKDTVGQLYLQHYDAEPETDYIVSNGVDGIWTYQKWFSGAAKCWGVFPLTTSITKRIEGIESDKDDVKIQLELFHNDTAMSNIKYPFSFIEVPSETATLQGANKLAWLANKDNNTKDQSASYAVVSLGTSNEIKLGISIQVEGFWR